MRFRSKKKDGFQVFAVSGVNTISFGISASDAAKEKLLGFAVERIDALESERFFVRGFKVFQSVIGLPDEDTQVSTFEHPVQSFVWDDFTAKPGQTYTYIFYPVRGKAKNLDHSAAPISIEVKAEELFSDTAEHQVFFNRGVASSQAYQRRFGNKKPEHLTEPGKKEEALQWLSRELDEAMLKFIDNVADGDTLLGCFYEFRYMPVLQALAKKAKEAELRVIIDAKDNSSVDKDGVFHEAFPREENLALIAEAKIPAKCILLREARASNIQHNKFMIRLEGKGAAAKPVEVWTGSTNLSEGGIHGQTNVGHWIRNESVAAAFYEYWKLLKGDPGGKAGDDAATVKAANKALREAVEALSPAPAGPRQIAAGTTPIFSPRPNLQVLDLYADLVDQSEINTAVTLAFGVSKAFKTRLADNTSANQIVFLLLEKRDKAKKGSEDVFVALTARHNVYSAWGAYLKNPVYQWTRETEARSLGFNRHVVYVHSKFLLHDPLGPSPVIVTGSANFSDASTKENDENMLIIAGGGKEEKRVADIYFTEFNRLWNHYYFRSVREALLDKGLPLADDSLFLAEDDSWTAKYKPGTLRSKRLAIYESMDLT